MKNNKSINNWVENDLNSEEKWILSDLSNNISKTVWMIIISWSSLIYSWVSNSWEYDYPVENQFSSLPNNISNKKNNNFNEDNSLKDWCDFEEEWSDFYETWCIWIEEYYD